MTPEEIKPGHTYDMKTGDRRRVDSINSGEVTATSIVSSQYPLAGFASLCVRDVTPAPESDQGEKVAQAQSQGASCGDGGGSTSELLLFAAQVAIVLYEMGARDDSPSPSGQLLRKARWLSGDERYRSSSEVNAELLAACKRHYDRIQRWLDTGVPAGPEESRSITEQLGAAIAKAEGRQ